MGWRRCGGDIEEGDVVGVGKSGGMNCGGRNYKRICF